jgi:hypothetical protein
MLRSGSRSQRSPRHRCLVAVAIAIVASPEFAAAGASQTPTAPATHAGIAQGKPLDPAPWQKRGLTLSAGVGYGYGLLGLQARFDLALRWWLHASPFLAGGTARGLSTEQLVAAAGISTGLGMRHRFAVDLAVAPYAFQDLNLHGSIVDRRTIYGPAVAGGYELFTAGGVLLRIMLGYAWGRWTQGSSTTLSGMTLTLGVGRRVW